MKRPGLTARSDAALRGSTAIRVGAFVLAMILLTAGGLPSAAAPHDDTGAPAIDYARYACVYHIESSTVMFTKNAEAKVYPASTVKLMTGVLAAEALGDSVSRRVTVTAEAVRGVRGNNIGLKAGESVTVGDLLAALVTGNANDAANVLAIETAGSVEAFVEKMNARAAELGMTNTLYTNPTGLHDKAMYTTVSDTMKIALVAYRNKVFLDLAESERYVMATTDMTATERRITNKNLFECDIVDARYKNKMMKGLNAGSTPEAGSCVVTVCDNGSYTYLCVVMGASSDADNIYSYVECEKLLKWAFTGYEYATILEGSELICELPVSLSGRTDFVSALPERSVELYLPSGIDVSAEVERVINLYTGSLEAPVDEGTAVGELSLFYKGELIDTVRLITKYPVDRSELEYRIGQLKALVSTRAFKASVVAAVVLFTAYVLTVAYLRGRKRKKTRYVRKR